MASVSEVNGSSVAEGSANVAKSSAATVPRHTADTDEPESSAEDLVQYPDHDIAINEYQERLRVGVAGRRRRQIIYVATSSTGKRSKDNYKPENDAPPDEQTVSILPTKQELEQGHNTEAHMVVGVILAHTPFLYSDRQQGTGGRNRTLANARSKRGVLPARKDLLRVTVPVTEYIPAAHKYYVACGQTHGICAMRVITSDAVFFFEEIHSSVASGANHRNRQTSLGQACRTLAAKNKTPDPRVLTVVKDSKAVCHDLEITCEQHAANMLLMQYSLWKVTKEPAQLDVLAETAKKILPDLEKKPSNAGTAAFYEFEEELTTEEAEKLVHEVKAAYPVICTLNAKLILIVHTIMRTNDLGASLPYGSIALFLELVHDRAQAGWEIETLTQVVRQILHDIELCNKYHATSCQWTASDEEEDTASALVGLISVLRELLRELQEYLSAGAKAVQEQHGGVQRHRSIDQLMQEIGAVVDKTALMTLEEQVFAIHAEQKATVLVRGAEYAGKGIKLIDAALGGEQVDAGKGEAVDVRAQEEEEEV